MKKLWNLVSIIALVNLLALLAGGAWLFSSGRMDKEKLKALLAPPEPAPEATTTGTEAPAEPEGDLTPTSVKIDAAERQRRAEAMGIRRANEEKVQLAKVLDQRERELTAERESFASTRKAWESSMTTTKATKVDEQFKKSVKLLESVPAKQAKEWILELVQAGNTDQAVAYIDAMSPFKASSLLKAFKGETENKVATDLLEKLRTRTPDTNADASVGPETAPAASADASTKPTNATADRPPNPAAQPAKPAPEPAGKPGTGSSTPAAEKPASDGKPVANRGAEIDPPGAASGRATGPSGSKQ
jgi:hypothetical protein